MSRSEQILLAAAALEAKGQSPFSAEALIVAAWEFNPTAFGLRGYPQFADSNRVLSLLMGHGGLVHGGMLQRMGPKLYALTGLGRTAARREAGHGS